MTLVGMLCAPDRTAGNTMGRALPISRLNYVSDLLEINPQEAHGAEAQPDQKPKHQLDSHRDLQTADRILSARVHLRITTR